MNSSCNIEEYDSWYGKPYEEELSDNFLLALVSTRRKDSEIWDIMDFENSREKFFSGYLAITNGQVMEASATLCRQSLSNLKQTLAGQHGPISERDIHDTMCNTHCALNDRLRFFSMNKTGCSCLELSILPDDSDLFKEEGSFCREHSGDYLCSVLGKCGNWECAISDYGCKRNEYNQIKVPLRGYGNECNTASRTFDAFSLIFITSVALIVLILT